MFKVNRKQVSIKKSFDDGLEYVDAAPEERIAFIWELTQEIWSLKDETSAKRRLQRHITNLIKKSG